MWMSKLKQTTDILPFFEKCKGGYLSVAEVVLSGPSKRQQVGGGFSDSLTLPRLVSQPLGICCFAIFSTKQLGRSPHLRLFRQSCLGLMLFVISMVSASVWILGVLLACSLVGVSEDKFTKIQDVFKVYLLFEI